MTPRLSTQCSETLPPMFSVMLENQFPDVGVLSGPKKGGLVRLFILKAGNPMLESRHATPRRSRPLLRKRPLRTACPRISNYEQKLETQKKRQHND